MKKAFFLTMDAVAALLVVLLIISASITLIEMTKQKTMVELERQARDIYEFNYWANKFSTTPEQPDWIKTNCQTATNIAVINSYQYDSLTKAIKKVTTSVCE